MILGLRYSKAFSTFALGHFFRRKVLHQLKSVTGYTNRFKECAKSTFSRSWKLNDKNIVAKSQ